MTHTVWFDASRDNFWRIPDESELADGDVEIRNLAGERRHVNAQSLEPHMVDREDARQAIFEQLRAAASTAGRALGAMAQGWLEDAQSVMPNGVSFEDLEERLGPMEGWLDSERAKETLQSGADSVRRTAQQAQDTLKRTSRVAGSAMRSARVVGKVMLDNPELAQTAGRMAQAVARVGGQ
ncbi:MAG: phage tail tape-measure protein, partial [Kiritimatiellia bacterium]